MSPTIEIILSVAALVVLVIIGQTISGKQKWYKNLKLLWSFIILKPILATTLQLTFPEPPNTFTFLDRLGAMINLFWFAILVYTIIYSVRATWNKNEGKNKK